MLNLSVLLLKNVLLSTYVFAVFKVGFMQFLPLVVGDSISQSDIFISCLFSM